MRSRAVRRLVRGVSFRTAEWYWLAWARLAGRFVHRPPTSTVGGGQRVLVIAAHPDDETVGCGGAIAAHIRAGDSVCVAIATDGASSRALGLDRRRMRDVREQEARAAMAELGVTDLTLIGASEGDWRATDVDRALGDVMRRVRPTVVYTVSCVDFHPEHVRVARTLWRAVAAAADPPGLMRVYATQVPLTPILWNVLIDTASVAGVRTRALGCYRSQSAEVERRRRNARYVSALTGSRTDVEAFWQMSPHAFVAVMSAADPAGEHFRGVRMRPFSDPLAWLVGARERRRLARIAGSAVPPRADAQDPERDGEQRGGSLERPR